MRIKSIPTFFARTVFAALLLVCLAPTSSDADSVHAARAAAAQGSSSTSEDSLFLTPMEASAPDRKRPGLMFHRADKSPASSQLASAESLEAGRERSAACKAYDRLVRSHPFSAEAATAQLKLGRLLEKMGKYKDAFEEYKYMLYYYPESVPADSVLRQMYAIANYFATNGKERRGRDFFLDIAEVAPQWRHTPDALLQAGLIQKKRKDYFDAAESFDKIISSGYGTALAKTAADQYALTLYALSCKYPEDELMRSRAISATKSALRDGDLASPDRTGLSDAINVLISRRYASNFEKAAFYDNSRFRDETKIAAYRNFLRRFPSAPQAERTKRRLADLGVSPESAGK